jgi:hypothetical protein
MTRGKRFAAAAVAAVNGLVLVYLSVSQAWQEIRQLNPGWKEARYASEVYWVWADNHAWYGIIGTLLVAVAAGLAASVKGRRLALRVGGAVMALAGSVLLGVLLQQAWEYARHHGIFLSILFYGPREMFLELLTKRKLMLAVSIAMILVGGLACFFPRRKAAKRKPEHLPDFAGVWTMATVLRLGRNYAVIQYDHEKKQTRLIRSRLPAGIRSGDRLCLQENGAFAKIG